MDAGLDLQDVGQLVPDQLEHLLAVERTLLHVGLCGHVVLLGFEFSPACYLIDGLAADGRPGQRLFLGHVRWSTADPSQPAHPSESGRRGLCEDGRIDRWPMSGGRRSDEVFGYAR